MAAVLRLFAPRASLALHARQLQPRILLPGLRHASSESPPKPRVLAKPERFNPPSHPARIRSKPKYRFGGELSKDEKEAQKKRRYPNMMPEEGTFLYWFLTQRNLHLYISLSVLVSLVFGIWLEDFLHNTPFRDILPPNDMLLAHPITYFTRFFEVYAMHVQYVSAQTAKMRQDKVDDVTKRSEYRKAHGLEDGDDKLGGWTAKASTDSSDAAGREGGKASLPLPSALESPTAVDTETYIDFDGKQQPIKKKWFGIW
ncbi:Hypothetical protein R9X50_00201100 [Acrodontium crateriforme]|uniref:Uncharacterized protein n=1 Tax=Acrodontium crateriforme TaxID=150365 RepID=A0AAQ3M3F6_9PEZI|nr:Hypothetical protein R9X50_00201100 [Acrodontium crateriforme]